MGAMPAPTPAPDLGAPLVGVEAVMARYGLVDRRAARRLMDRAGAFRIGRRLYVRAGDLLAHEDALQAARSAPRMPQAPAPARRDVRTSGRPAPAELLRAGWWREEP